MTIVNNKSQKTRTKKQKTKKQKTKGEEQITQGMKEGSAF